MAIPIDTAQTIPWSKPRRALPKATVINRWKRLASTTRTQGGICSSTRVEHILKRVILYIHPKGSAQGIEALEQLQREVKRQTLGDMMQSFAEAIVGDAQGLSNDLMVLVRARNDLVHRLLILPGMDLLSEEGRHLAAEYLDFRFEQAQRFKDSTLLPQLVRINRSQETRFCST